MASPVIFTIYYRLFRTIKNKMISMRQGFKVRQLLREIKVNKIINQKQKDKQISF